MNDDIHWRSRATQEEADHARMVAAAPELLEALRRLVEWYGHRKGWNDALLPADQQGHLIGPAMRAIAKATGDSP